VVSQRVAWGRRLQAIAQTGLAYGEPTIYDRERYEDVRRIAAELLEHSDLPAREREGVLAGEEGHATPKLDVRGVVFRDEEILLTQEQADGLWTLPGGWADVGESPSEAVTREVLETGYETRAVKLLALELVRDEQAELSWETSDARFFPRDNIPELSPMRVTPRYIERFFEHRNHPEWAADFD
jgi:8-oxo-dGTP pyrophosphatase MutT (NUDIX family)